MNRRITTVILLAMFMLAAVPVEAAEIVDLNKSENFKSYNFAIIKTMFNGTGPGSKEYIVPLQRGG